MKKIILYSALACLTIVGCKKSVDNGVSADTIVSESAVPSAVISSFNDDFSTSTEREWVYKSNDDYSCQFNMDDKRQQAEFGDDGHKSSQTTICIDAAVPAAVLASFRAGFPNDFVYEWKLTSDNEWKAHFLRGSIKWEVTIDNEGNIIKSEHD